MRQIANTCQDKKSNAVQNISFDAACFLVYHDSLQQVINTFPENANNMACQYT